MIILKLNYHFGVTKQKSFKIGTLNLCTWLALWINQ